MDRAERPMRILWSSNGMHTGTGYANQTALFVPRLAAMGHEMGVFAWWGLQGGPLNYGFSYGGSNYPVTLYPCGRDGYGNDMVREHADQHRADLVISLIDAWVLDPEQHGGAKRWACWFPVDSWPIAPRVLAAAKEAAFPIVYSRFAERMAHDAGLDVAYVPHGVDTAVFAPGDQGEARERLKLPADDMIYLVVAANKGNPSRKAFPQILTAFAHLARKHPDVRLYLHTNLDGDVNLRALIERLDIGDRVTATGQYGIKAGALNEAHMRTMYQACDVLVSPSLGEGFGIPILEAQACGVPVITGDWSAMPEITFSGFCIPQPADHVTGYGPVRDETWNALDSNWQTPRVGDILFAMEELYQDRANAERWTHFQAAARAGALFYDADTVTDRYWRPVLDRIAERLGVARVVTPETFAAPEQWLATGLYDSDGALCVPSRDPKSAAALRIYPDGTRTVDPDGWPMDADGIPLDIEDDPTGGVAKIVCREIVSAYGLNDLDLRPGDVVIDLGAQVGVVACYLLKKYPGIRYRGIEAQPKNAERLRRNLISNAKMGRWSISAGAVTGDGRDVVIAGDLSQNSGGSSIYGDGPDSATVKSVTLTDLAADDVCIALLKVDIEGAEYEVLRASEDVLRRVRVIAIEVHERPGEDGAALVNWLVGLGCEARVNGRRFTAEGVTV